MSRVRRRSAKSPTTAWGGNARKQNRSV